jgi:hypothetical protein
MMDEFLTNTKDPYSKEGFIMLEYGRMFSKVMNEFENISRNIIDKAFQLVPG